MRYFLILLCCFAASIGCQKDQTKYGVTSGWGIGRISALAESSLKSNPTPATVKNNLEAIAAEVPFVKAQFETDAKIINTLNTKLATADEQVVAAQNNEKATVKSYSNRWVGDRTFRESRRIVVTFFLLLVLGAALSEFAVTRWVGTILLNALNPFTYLRIFKKWIWGK